MRRYGAFLAGLVVVVLLAGTCYVAQHDPDAATGLVLQQKFPNHTSWVYTADFDEKDELVASGGEDGLRVWNVDEAREVYHRPGRVFLARFVKGGVLVCADANEGVLLLDTQTWEVRKKFGQKGARIVAAVTDAGDRIAASFSVGEKQDTHPSMSFEIHVWQHVDKEWRESVLRGHQGPVFALAFHPVAHCLISRGEDGTMRVWDLRSDKQIDQRGKGVVRNGHHVPDAQSACALSPEGTRLVFANIVCDYATEDEMPLRKTTEQFIGGKDLNPVRSAMFSADGQWIVTGHKDGTLQLWDGRTLAKRTMVKGSINGSPLNEVRFSRSGKFIVTAGEGIVPGFAALGQKVKPDDTVVRIWGHGRLSGPGQKGLIKS